MSTVTGTVVVGSVRAMACDVTVQVPADAATDAATAGVEAALSVFRTVHRTCTRFDPDSPLMRVNARPDRWHTVPQVLFAAVREAHSAYVRTRGRFDPRVLADLERLGYDRSLPFEDGPVVATAGGMPGPARSTRGRWRPRFRGGDRPELHLGGDAVDLGGIGKGLALRWARARLSVTTPDHLIDAGGDCVCQGTGGGPDHGTDGWRIGVEHPSGPGGPAAVLALADRAVATSSTRLRRWTSADGPAHHLIDPRSGRPGGRGLAAVTVVAADPAAAEVATKSLFLRGAAGIAPEARRRSIAALWVGTDGSVATSGRMDDYVIWRAP
jgi:FAD:protein FMN transferase